MKRGRLAKQALRFARALPIVEASSVACLAGVACLASTMLAGCPRPTDGDPQILVSPDAARRQYLLPSRAPKEIPEPKVRARAHPMADEPAARLGGPNATGRPGDWVLENGEVVFVVSGLGGGAGFAESGGNIVDAADARTRKDELGQIFTYFGRFPRQAVYTSMRGREEPDGTAVIEVRGKELAEPAFEVTTEYRLAGADRALLLRTTVKNTSARALRIPGLGDAIQWGAAEKVAPSMPRGFRGPSSGAFVGGVGRFVSYALTSTDGAIEAISGGAWTDTIQRKDVAIGAGESVTYERVLVVGERGDTASAIVELAKAAGEEVGRVEVRVVDASGAPVVLPEGARLVLGPPGGPDVFDVVFARRGDRFEAEVPPGKWRVGFAPSVGRRASSGAAPAQVDVAPRGASQATVVVTPAAGLSVGCESREVRESSSRDAARPVPCKVTIEGLRGTETPSFGPSHVATLAKNQVFTIGPPRELPIPPGSYRLTFSRGPEYALVTEDLTLAAGATSLVVRQLSRVVDTAGYVATDFHQHTSASADSGVAYEDRVIGNAVEAVEVAVTSEHNFVADLRGVARSLGLAPYVVHLPGNEITTDAIRAPWGHMNVFPLEPDLGHPRRGAVEVRDRTAASVVAEVRALPGSPRIVQVNHPRSGDNGYFDRLGFDRASGVGRGAGYTADFDVLEVWNGRDAAKRDEVLRDYFALLAAGRPVTPIADTDTHGVVGQEAGLPRTYVRISRDDALDAWTEARTAELVASVRERRDVVLTNGPMIAVTAGGAGIGEVARAEGGVVDVEVVVTSAPFVVIDRVEIRAVRTAAARGQASVAVTPRPSASGALVARARFSLAVKEDDAFVVIARGARPMRPIYEGDDVEIAPWAMSGAIWVDADGDGRALGRARAPR